MKRKHEHIHSEGKMSDCARTLKPTVLWNRCALWGSIAVIRYWSGRRRPSIILSAWPSYDPRRRQRRGEMCEYMHVGVFYLAQLSYLQHRDQKVNIVCLNLKAWHIPSRLVIRVNLQTVSLLVALIGRAWLISISKLSCCSRVCVS